MFTTPPPPMVRGPYCYTHEVVLLFGLILYTLEVIKVAFLLFAFNVK